MLIPPGEVIFSSAMAYRMTRKKNLLLSRKKAGRKGGQTDVPASAPESESIDAESIPSTPTRKEPMIGTDSF